MLRAAALLAAVSVVIALPAAAASDATAAKSVTIRVFVIAVTRNIKDVPPKTLNLGEHTKGDTMSGTSILRNAVRQFGKPKYARVGTSSFVNVTLSARRARTDAVARIPGGTVHAHGVGEIGPNPKVPVVGGTGRYAGATGLVEGRVLPSGQQLNILRLRIP
jgi:hypothetical protein